MVPDSFEETVPVTGELNRRDPGRRPATGVQDRLRVRTTSAWGGTATVTVPPAGPTRDRSPPIALDGVNRTGPESVEAVPLQVPGGSATATSHAIPAGWFRIRTMAAFPPPGSEVANATRPGTSVVAGTTDPERSSASSLMAQ